MGQFSSIALAAVALCLFLVSENCGASAGRSPKASEAILEAICLNATMGLTSFDTADVFLVGEKNSLQDGRTLCADDIAFYSHVGSHAFRESRGPGEAWERVGWRVALGSGRRKGETASQKPKKTNAKSFIESGKDSLGKDSEISPVDETAFQELMGTHPMVQEFISEKMGYLTENSGKLLAVVLHDSKGPISSVSYLLFRATDNKIVDFYVHEAQLSVPNFQRREILETKEPKEASFMSKPSTSPSPTPSPSPSLSPSPFLSSESVAFIQIPAVPSLFRGVSSSKSSSQFSSLSVPGGSLLSPPPPPFPTSSVTPSSVTPSPPLCEDDYGCETGSGTISLRATTPCARLFCTPNPMILKTCIKGNKMYPACLKVCVCKK